MYHNTLVKAATRNLHVLFLAAPVDKSGINSTVVCLGDLSLDSLCISFGSK